MKLGMIITQADSETVFNALRLALYSLELGDDVRIFLSGKGVEIDRISDPKSALFRPLRIITRSYGTRTDL
jgi:uncharacterized protein involved in oxidation of intracellular sulfur